MVEQLLGGLFGGQDDEDDERRRGRAQDFVSRYEQGPPYEGIGADEAYHNYRNVAGRLSPEEYEEAAAEAFTRRAAGAPYPRSGRSAGRPGEPVGRSGR